MARYRLDQDRNGTRSNADKRTPICMPGAIGTNACHNFTQKTRAIFETTAVITFTSVRTQKLMTEISMTMLDVHELKTELASDASGGDEFVDDLTNLAISQYRIAVVDVDSPIEGWMMIKNRGSGFVFSFGRLKRPE